MTRLATAFALVVGTCSAPAHSSHVTTARGSLSPTSSVRAAAPPPLAHPVAGGAAPSAGRASWYARGRTTASGERFDPDGLTFAHRTMTFGSLVRFCRGAACVVARCTDRGPAAWTGREFDLSRGAFSAIAPLSRGVIDVTWEAA